MKLKEHIANRQEKPSNFAKRLGLPVPTITRYLKGERGLGVNSVRAILEDAGGALSLNDLCPNPYRQDKPKGEGG